MSNILSKLSRRGFIKGAAESAAIMALFGRDAAEAAASPAGGSPNAHASQETYRLTRKIPVERGYDVVVAGGGPAGTAAAISAGRLGAKVLLLEAVGSMGGMGTNAYVSQWAPLGDGENMVVGGLTLEYAEDLCREKQVEPTPAAENYVRGKYLNQLGFNPEALKMLLDKLCHEAGVEVRFFTRVVDADADSRTGRVNGVITNNIEGYRYIAARTFIDCTGDAVLTNLCGAKVLDAENPDIMPASLCSLISDIDYTRFDPHQQEAMVEQAIADKFFLEPDQHVPGLFRSGSNTATLNAAHLFHTNALECRSLSDAIARGRVLVQNYLAFYRKYLKGCEQMKVMATGALLGVRQSRRIVGEYVLNYEDFKARRKFPDQIGIYAKPIDIHPYDLSPEQYKRYYEEFTSLAEGRFKKGESYGIPYGVLVPKGWANLWVAGRCVSTDVQVNGSIRDQPGCMMEGQAAGTAAVQSIRTGQSARDLDTAQLVLTLRQAGANLPQESLSKTMTRSVT